MSKSATYTFLAYRASEKAEEFPNSISLFRAVNRKLSEVYESSNASKEAIAKSLTTLVDSELFAFLKDGTQTTAANPIERPVSAIASSRLWEEVNSEEKDQAKNKNSLIEELVKNIKQEVAKETDLRK